MNICKNKYRCSFDCKDCCYEGIEHFRRLFNETPLNNKKNNSAKELLKFKFL